MTDDTTDPKSEDHLPISGEVQPDPSEQDSPMYGGEDDEIISKTTEESDDEEE